MPNHADETPEVPHRTFAAIKISRENIHTMLASVSDSNGGVDRLVDALWRYPYRAGVTYYFIGGRFRKSHMPYPEYGEHILTQDELNLLFTYNKPKPRRGGKNPDVNWFPVTLADLEDEEMIA